jgi:hypothetical protein
MCVFIQRKTNSIVGYAQNRYNNYTISTENGNSKAPAQKLNQQHPKKCLKEIAS